MAWNEIETQKIRKTVAAFVEEHRPPVHLRDEIDLGFRITGQSVELFEIRPAWNRPHEKMESAVAKARYLKTRREWWVYWQRADLKWHRYGPVPAVRTLEKFLAVVKADEYACFFG
jgi:hypothetical protein